MGGILVAFKGVAFMHKLTRAQTSTCPNLKNLEPQTLSVLFGKLTLNTLEEAANSEPLSP